MNNSKNTILRAEQSRAEQSRAEQTRVIGCMPGYEVANRVYDTDYLAPTIRCYQGGGLQPKFIEVKEMADTVMIKQATKDGYIECEVPGIADLNYVSSTTRRGRVQEGGQISPTIATENTPSVIEPWVWEIDGVRYKIRIRKLTPKECFRLMSFSDEDFEKAENVVSNTQLYRASGDSIVEEVLKAIFSNLF